ncbi:MAG: UDP-N-acetylmuramoyl-L-alanine--D-glutamate ligase [Clostridia bacterium]|nr:UDP-N-acetylmuramoyl-L-alanine--D-glutamate ligase [Clostridia bacterium]
MDIANKKVLIIGMARSGLAAASILAKQGVLVSIYDQKSRENLLEELKTLSGLNIDFYLGGHEPEISRDSFDLVVTSPGVPLSASPIVKAYEHGLPVWSELELAYTMTKSPIIAVTGTNGKTTTTALIGDILERTGKKVKVAGNIGIPLIKEIAAADTSTYLVVEVSSFQLETIHSFNPKVAVLLNITPDHLDRHKTMENYIAAKGNIFINQTSHDYAVLNYDDNITRGFASKIKSRVIFFSTKHKLEQGVFLEDGIICTNWNGKTERIIEWEKVRIKGTHNLENSMAAVGVALTLGLDRNGLYQSLNNFPGVPHRLEPVGEVAGVLYINDSKGTNPEATIKALEAYADRDIVLIAGGMDKGSSFKELAQILTRLKVKVVVFGETADTIRDAVLEAGINGCYKVKDLEEAVELSKNIALKGGVVLLSPACASWDMYKNYEERGDHFRSLVKRQWGERG